MKSLSTVIVIVVLAGIVSLLINSTATPKNGVSAKLEKVKQNSTTTVPIMPARSDAEQSGGEDSTIFPGELQNLLEDKTAESNIPIKN